jgi:hypothetical protein
MVISQTQLAVLIVLVTGAIGARRGWGRELVTCAIVLSTLVFLQLGGSTFLSNIFANGLTPAAGAAGTSSSCGAGGSVSTVTASKSISEFIFGGMVWLGYYAGSRHGAASEAASARLLGIVPGVITGGAIAYYLNSVIYPGAAAFLQWLSALAFLASLPLLLSLALGGALVFLAYTWRGGKSGSSKGH